MKPESDLPNTQAGNSAGSGDLLAIPPPHFATPDDRECYRLRAALEPFARYAMKHGAFNLHGRNGAYLSADAWVEAHVAFHSSPNAGGMPDGGNAAK